MPTISASSAAALTYPDVPSSTSGASADAVSNDTMATGPTESWRDEPNRA